MFDFFQVFVSLLVGCVMGVAIGVSIPIAMFRGRWRQYRNQQAEIVEQGKRLSLLRKLVAEYDHKLQLWQSDCDNRLGQVKKMCDEAVQKENETLQQRKAMVREKCTQLENNYAQRKARIDDDIKAIDAEYEIMKSKRQDQIENELTDLLQLKSKRMGEIADIEHCLDELQSALGDAKETIAMGEKTEKRLDYLDGILERTREQIAQDDLNHDLRSRERESELLKIKQQIDNAHREYSFRKTLPETHEKLKEKHESVVAERRELLEEIKSLRQQLKEKKSDDKTMTVAIAKLQRLADDYIADTVKFALARLTTSNYSANRDRISKTIEKCRAYGFDIPTDEESKHVEKLQEEFKRIVRINEQRAEQSRIKAQMREEEKLRRDLEKVREQAEREQAAAEKALREAIARAEEESLRQSLTEAEKVATAAEIAALQQRLEEAEAKSQRATSQAQLTKAGNVYVISNIGSFGEKIYKIGMTRRLEPMDRVRELGDASVPFPFEVHMMISCEDAPKLENELHKRFQRCMLNKTNPRREFFKLELEEIKQAVKDHSEGNTVVEYTVDEEVLEYVQSQRMSESDAEFIEHTFEELGEDDMTDID